jgi:hypothetical protein
MTPGQLVKAVSIALDVPEETIVQHDRNLVVAGLRTKGGRGRSAPAVTPLDAARLLVATLGSVRTKDSVDTVCAFEKTKFDPPKSTAEIVAAARAKGIVLKGQENRIYSTDKFIDQALMTLPPDHSLVDAIAALISDASVPAPNFVEYLQRFAPIIITCTTPRVEAKIGHMAQVSSSVAYRKPVKISAEASREYINVPKHERYARLYGLLQTRHVYGPAIMLLGRAFRENGLNFETTKEAIADLLGDKPTKKSKNQRAAQR